MKRALKITAITLSSIIAILAIAIIIVCNIVFSPKTLTPIVRNNVGRFITCQADLDTAELTFFSTFPNFAINLSNVRVINPMAEAQSDTLAYVGRLAASVNVSQFLFKGNLVINQVHLDNTTANIFCDSLGNANYNIVALSSTEEEEDTASTSLFDLLQVNDVVINNLYANMTTGRIAGCTQVFNYAILDKACKLSYDIINNDTKLLPYHDWWVANISYCLSDNFFVS